MNYYHISVSGTACLTIVLIGDLGNLEIIYLELRKTFSVACSNNSLMIYLMVQTVTSFGDKFHSCVLVSLRSGLWLGQAFLPASHSGVDLLLCHKHTARKVRLDGLVFDFIVLWLIEDFMVNFITTRSSICKTSPKLSLPHRAWQTVETFCFCQAQDFVFTEHCMTQFHPTCRKDTEVWLFAMVMQSGVFMVFMSWIPSTPAISSVKTDGCYWHQQAACSLTCWLSSVESDWTLPFIPVSLRTLYQFFIFFTCFGKDWKASSLAIVFNVLHLCPSILTVK